MTLHGNHSESRSNAAFKWWSEVSLASVNLAASELENGTVVALFLTLNGAYAKYAEQQVAH